MSEFQTLGGEGDSRNKRGVLFGFYKLQLMQKV